MRPAANCRGPARCSKKVAADPAPGRPRSVATKAVTSCKQLTQTNGTWMYHPRYNAAGDRVAFQLGIYQYDYTPAEIAVVDTTLSNQTMQYWTVLTTPTYGPSYVKTSD